MTRHRRGAAGALGIALAVLAGCSGGGGASSSYVTRSGTQLQIDGEPFRFVGFNLYDAAATDVFSCSPATRLTDRQLETALRTAREDAGATVVRFWAYQTYTAGGTDFSGIDRVLRAARAAGVRALPVLEDGPGDCTTGQDGVPKNEVDGDTWYTEGYRRPYGDARLSYRDYVQVVARHYRDDPTVLAWMMMNEAETGKRDDRDRSALVGFAEDVGAVLRGADPHHLITLGTQANGAFGTSGRDVTDIYGLPVLDVAEAHDWGFYGSDTDPLPGSQDGGLPDPTSDACTALDAEIACTFARVAALGKPMIVGEAGIKAGDAAGRERRADLLGAKLDAAFSAGVAGYVLWHLSPAQTDGYDIATDGSDPVFGVLHRVADGLGPG